MVVDMKADDRHLNKTIKDRVYNAKNANTVICKGQPKAKPLKVPQDCYKLGKLPSLLRAQLQANNTISFDEKVDLFQKRVKNALVHYFNDEKGKHGSCMECGFLECEVVQAQVHNMLATVWRVAFQKGAQLPNKPMKVIAGFLGYYGTESTLPISTMIDLNLVKPKLADGMWLGERCVDEEQLAGFRRDLESIYAELACTKTAKIIIMTNNTQKNEALGVNPAFIERMSTTGTV